MTMDGSLLDAAAESSGSIQGKLVRKTALDSALYFPTIVVQGLVGLVTASLLSKLFSPDQYGNYVLAFGIYSLLSIITGIWLNYSIVRLLPEYKAKDRFQDLALTLIVSEMVIVFSLSIGAALLLALAKPHINAQLVQLLVVVLLGFPVLVGYEGIATVYRASGHSAHCSGLILTRVLGGLCLGLILAIKLQWDLVGFFIGLIIPMVCVLLLFTWTQRLCLVALFSRATFSRMILRDALRYSLPFVGMSLAAMILSNSDRYFIGGYLSTYEVGIYSVGYTIANQAMQLNVSGMLAAAEPVAMTAWEDHGPAATYRFMDQLFRYYALLAIPTLVGLLILSKELIAVFSTFEYVQGAPVVAYIGLGMLFHGYTQLLNTVFALAKRTMIVFINFAMAGAINVLLNILLIPRFGYLGAAWSTLVSYLLLFALALLTSRQIISLSLWGGYLWKALVATVGMGLAVYLSKSMFASTVLNLAISAVAGLLCYTALILALGGLTASETRSIGHLAKRLIFRIHGSLAASAGHLLH
jgi:O-antigen/teichoic acid export membrane protein